MMTRHAQNNNNRKDGLANGIPEGVFRVCIIWERQEKGIKGSRCTKLYEALHMTRSAFERRVGQRPSRRTMEDGITQCHAGLSISGKTIGSLVEDAEGVMVVRGMP